MKHPYHASDKTAIDQTSPLPPSRLGRPMFKKNNNNNNNNKNCDRKNNWTRKNLYFSLPNSQSRWYKIVIFHFFSKVHSKKLLY